MVSVEHALETLARAPCRVVLEGPWATADAFLGQVNAWRLTVRAARARSVALYSDDRAQFSAALFGAWLAGAEVLLPGDALPRTVAALQGRCDAFLGELPGALEPTVGPPPESWVVSSDAQLVVFTSGTTGEPSAIAKRLRQLSAEVASLEATFHPGPGAVLATVTHQHIYGLLFTVLWPLAAGRPFSSRRLEYPEEIEAALGAQAALLVTSPAHLKRLPERARPLEPRPLAVYSSGGPLSDEGARRCRAVFGRAPIEVYGSSETGGVAFRERADGPLTPFEPLPGVRWRVGPDGALEVCSPHLADDGWYVTADFATAVGVGERRHFLLGPRADRIAKVEEKRVSLNAVEARLRESGLVSEARAVVLEAGRTTVGVLAVPSERGRALLTQGKKSLVDALKAALADTLERVTLPRRFRFVDELPLTPQGKTPDALVVAALAPFTPSPRWVERGEVRAVLSFEVDPALRVLQGHFPEAAIVPGVAQLDWAIAWTLEAFGPATARVARAARIDALKFQALMRPGHHVSLELVWSPDKSTVTFRYSGPDGIAFSSGRVTIEFQ